MRFVSSWPARFAAGERIETWIEVRRLGPVPPDASDEVAELASLTMQQAGRQFFRIAEQLLATGLRAAFGATLVAEPSVDVRAQIAALAGSLGAIPAALSASFEHVGSVSFVGDCPALGLYYNEPGPATSAMPPGPQFPDPLVVPGVEQLAYEWDAWRADERLADQSFMFPFAPDELHKANVSGSTHDLNLPEAVADPVLHGIAGRPGITLIEYLRVSVEWGGLPGYAFAPDSAPSALHAMRAQPLF